MSDEQKQKGGDHSVNNQAGHDIVINNFLMCSTEEVSKKLLYSVFGELPEDTKKQIEDNQKSYFQELSDQLKKIKKNHEEMEVIIDSPDFQYILKKAVVSASRSSSKELHNSLSSLIIQRINYDKEDLQRIIYNEAILTVEKLTENQLKILTLFFLITKTKISGLKDVYTFAHSFNSKIKYFIDFKVDQIQFEHLAYTGCSTFSVAVRGLEQLIQSNYPEFFDTDDAIKKMLEQGSFSGLVSAWKSPVSNMNITSVGIAIAITYYEKILNEHLNADIWLH